MVNSSHLTNVSNMYDRVGNCGGHLDKRIPRCYSALVLPSKQELKVRGLNDSSAQWGRTRDHPYAKWETHPFERGTSIQEALAIVEAFQIGNDRIAKMRITFTDGTHISMQRKVPARPDTLKAVGTYDPNEVFHERTQEVSMLSRTQQLKRTMPIVDDKGHIAHRRAGSLSSFAPEKLFGDCPVVETSQTGFSFTPMGYNSFMVRPNYRIPGCKPTIASFSDTAINYRPRGYGNGDFPNYEEVTGRNEVSKPRSQRAGEDIYTGAFLRQTEGKGAPLSPSFLRNTATKSLSNTYANALSAARKGAGRALPSVKGQFNTSNNSYNNYNNNERPPSAAAGSNATNIGSGADDDNSVHAYSPSNNRNNNNGGKVVLSPGGRVRVHYSDEKASNTSHHEAIQRSFEEAPPTPVTSD